MARTEQLSVRRQLRGVPVAKVREQLDPANVRSFAESSPGRLIAFGLLLIALCLSAGWVTASAVGDRQHALDVLLDDTEPDAHSAHRLYTSLSIADAAAATAFIAGGLEPEPVRNRYNQAVNAAAAELVTQSGQGAGPAADGAPDTRLRTGIATGLPVYTGVIETARTNNRIGYPVGAAYLSEASHQMQTSLLPMAQELQSHRSDAVDAAQSRHVRPPWLSIALLLVTLGVLGWVQRDLARRWRRTLNAGLLLATGSVLILLAWTVIAGSISAAAVIQGRDEGAGPGSRLTETRILAQQARSAETLKLVNRDATGDYDRTYNNGMTRMNELLTGYPKDAPAADHLAEARSALDRWRVAHQRMNETLDRGDFTGAAVVATGAGAADVAAQVDALDRALELSLNETRSALRGNISQSARVLDFLGPGALALSIAAAGYVGLGIWPRLREYR
ncbi:hypothetical protein AB0H76_22660 [Nocardia sp. NPDC050712]|uniref:hypothetical protein n=1 Tax=Nocardia sp. NPDC050712 TaxID=3155518 RepID=UPI0034035219